MTDKEYQQAKWQCWNTFKRECECDVNSLTADAFFAAFDHAYLLGKQEENKKRSTLTQNEKYALESTISELESLMEGTLDQDYRKEQRIVINALKRIIKKFRKL